MEPIVEDENGRKVIKCHRINWRDLSEVEYMEVRHFYWAAVYG